MTTPSQRVQADAAAQLRRLLHAVELGHLDAPGPAGTRLLHLMEGAATAWETPPNPSAGRAAGPGAAIHLEPAAFSDPEPPEVAPAPGPMCVRAGCDQPAPGGRLCPRHLYG